MEPNINIDTTPTSTIPNDASSFNQTPVIPPQPQKSKGPLVAIVCLSVLAIAGIACAIYFFLDSNNKSAEISQLQSELQSSQSTTSEETEIIVTETPEIDNTTAQNIVDPYLKSFSYLNNALDYDFSEDVKAEIAYLNLSPSSINESPVLDGNTIMSFKVSYSSLNDSYQHLFGSGSELAKKDYNPGHTNTFAYSSDVNSFTISQYYGGGTGGSTFSIVKDAYYGDNLIINVYHDHIPWCDMEGVGDYCYDADYKKSDVNIDDGNIKDIIDKYGDEIPVYKMTFTKDAGHYVLEGIQKQQ